VISRLVLEDVHTFYGTSHILFGIHCAVNEGECVCLLGRNGVGKTTTLKSIIGLTPPRQGRITYNDQTLIGLPPYEIARLGIGYVPDDRLVFPDLTVRENLEIAVKPSRSGGQEPWTVDRIYEFFPNLKNLDDHKGGYLSGGEQQMLTMGRTLMGNPALMLLDEPVEGLAPVIVKEITHQIGHLKKLGLSILFAEQNVQFAMEISDRGYILEGGQVRYEGTISDLEEKPEIKQKYLMI
jgi:branched-chain amino acid transport system ATP-binding protein